MVEVPNDCHISDELWVGHEPCQELAAVECGQGCLLIDLQLFLLHGRYDGHLQCISNRLAAETELQWYLVAHTYVPCSACILLTAASDL